MSVGNCQDEDLLTGTLIDDLEGKLMEQEASAALHVNAPAFRELAYLFDSLPDLDFKAACRFETAFPVPRDRS